jgi:hypothetical protein
MINGQDSIYSQQFTHSATTSHSSRTHRPQQSRLPVIDCQKVFAGCKQAFENIISKTLRRSASPPAHDPKNELEIVLSKQIAELKNKNQETAQILAHIKEIIESNERLLSKFQESVATTQEILLPPLIFDLSKSVNDPIVEEWRVEAHKQSYLEAMKTRFRDFLDKNPEFSDLFKSFLDKRTHQNDEQRGDIFCQEVHPVVTVEEVEDSEIVSPQDQRKLVPIAPDETHTDPLELPVEPAVLPKNQWHLQTTMANQTALLALKPVQPTLLLENQRHVSREPFAKSSR